MFNNRLRNFVCEESGEWKIWHLRACTGSARHDTFIVMITMCRVMSQLGTFRNRRKFAIVYAQHSVLSADIETLNTVKCHEVITNEHREKIIIFIDYHFYDNYFSVLVFLNE